ncbi:MAG TPA: hypothetical protein VFI84_00825 [Candidatus Saccharimonadales bacterium]|nr:hypothetical protein [Candidatus Saccharimonadales bacterium]
MAFESKPEPKTPHESSLQGEAAALMHDLPLGGKEVDDLWRSVAPDDENMQIALTFANNVAAATGDPHAKFAIMQGYLLRPAIEQRHADQKKLEDLFDEQPIQPPLMAAIGDVAAHEAISTEYIPQQEQYTQGKESSAA